MIQARQSSQRWLIGAARVPEGEHLQVAFMLPVVDEMADAVEEQAAYASGPAAFVAGTQSWLCRQQRDCLTKVCSNRARGRPADCPPTRLRQLEPDPRLARRS